MNLKLIKFFLGLGSRLEDGGHPDRQVLQLIQKGQGTRKDESYCPGNISREERS